MVFLGGGAVSYERGTPVPLDLFDEELNAIQTTLAGAPALSSSSSSLLSNLALSDEKVYAP